MKNKANVLVAAVAGIGVWVGAIFLFNSDSETHPPTTETPQVESQPHSEEQENEATPDVTSFAQAKAICPNNQKCIHKGLIAEFGSACKSWVKLETDMDFTASSEGLPKRVFHSSDPATNNHHWRLLGDAFYNTNTGVRYWYGCEVNTATGKIESIAPPVPIGTERRYKQFN